MRKSWEQDFRTFGKFELFKKVQIFRIGCVLNAPGV